MHPSHPLLRPHREKGHHKVTYVELFFDLVFVFAITQVSHTLMRHFTPTGVLQAAMLMTGVWWIWIFTSWFTNWMDPEKLPVRCALLALMLAGLFLSASLPEAFEGRGLSFAIAYVTMQVGRSAFFLFAVRHPAPMVRNFQRITIWLAAAGVFWIAGGLAHDGFRLALWAIALGIELLSPSTYFWVPGMGGSTLEDWEIEGAHMAERCALFIIIALGESILVTGATFADLQWSMTTIGAFIICLTGSIAMWWLYFDTSVEAGSRNIEHSAAPGRVARLAYTYIHLIIVAGIVLSAVSDEFLLHHPLGHVELPMAFAMIGSAVAYLAGNLLFKRAVINRTPYSHATAIAILLALWPLAKFMTPLLLAACVTVVLIVVAAFERAKCRPLIEKAHVA